MRSRLTLQTDSWAHLKLSGAHKVKLESFSSVFLTKIVLRGSGILSFVGRGNDCFFRHHRVIHLVGKGSLTLPLSYSVCTTVCVCVHGYGEGNGVRTSVCAVRPLLLPLKT